MADMHYNNSGQTVTEEQHLRHPLAVKQRISEQEIEGSSLKSERQNPPSETCMRSLENNFMDNRSLDFIESGKLLLNEDSTRTANKLRSDDVFVFKDHIGVNFECLSAEKSTSSPYDETVVSGRFTSQENLTAQNSASKTSFCIEALLGKATTKYISEQQSEKANVSMKIYQSPGSSFRISPSVSNQNDTDIGYKCIVTGEDQGDCASRIQSAAHLPLESTATHRNIIQCGAKRDEEFLLKDHQYKNDEINNEDSIDVDGVDTLNEGSNRNGSASPGSNGTHSAVSSPPISPGSEDPASNSNLGSSNLGASNFPIGAAVHPRQNQGLLLQNGPLVHHAGLYYHPASGSAFHSIHKDGQAIAHPQSSGPHAQHHIHPLQLEWLARTGMLYPRLPADLAGNIYTLF